LIPCRSVEPEPARLNNRHAYVGIRFKLYLSSEVNRAQEYRVACCIIRIISLFPTASLCRGVLGLTGDALEISGHPLSGSPAKKGLSMRSGVGSAIRILVLTGVLAAISTSVFAQTKVRLVLDWDTQGYHAPFLLAAEKGYFADEGISIAIDRGYGSGDTVVKVASGAYDIGFCDISAVIKFDAENQDNKVLNFFQIFDKTFAVVVSKKTTAINSPKDLEGKSIAAPLGDPARLLFGAFAAATGLDATKVKWLTVASNLREPMLMRDEAQAVAGSTVAILFTLKGIGASEKDLNTFMYADFGLDLYASGLITRSDYAQKNPQILKGIVRAVVKGLQETIRDPKAAVTYLKKKDPLVNEELELARLQYTLSTLILTKHVKENGFGSIVAPRMEKGIALTVSAYGLPKSPPASEIYSLDYLPEKSARMP